MNMIVSKSDINIMENINNEATWKQIAEGWNFHQKLGESLFEATVVKGKEEGLNNEEIVKTLLFNGCSIKADMINKKLRFYDFKQELSTLIHVSDNLNIPETEAQYRGLGKSTEFTSAQEKVEEFNEITKELNGKTPSHLETQQRNKSIELFNEEITQIKKEKQPKNDEPTDFFNGKTYFNPDDLTSFRKWCIQEKGINPIDDKPEVNMMALGNERDDIINELARRVPEWKSARKLSLKLLHPDTGGNTLAYQFFEYFDSIMSNIVKAYEYVEFNNKIDAFKKEWITTNA